MAIKPINIILISFVFLLIALTAINLIPVLIITLVAAFFYLIYKEDFILLLIIVLFISFTSFVFKGARDVTNTLSIAILFFLFIKHYGFKVSAYPDIPTEVFYLILLLFLTIIISSLFSAAMIASFISVLHAIIFFTLCYIIYSLIKDEKRIYLYIFGLIISEFIIGISIYSDFIKGGFSFYIQNGILARFAGVYSNPNLVGLTSFIAACFILGLFFIERFSSKKYRIILTLLFINNILIFIITDSRAAGIALIVGYFFILYNLNKKLLLKVSILSVILILVLLLLPPIQELIMILLRVEEGSRGHVWSEGLNMFGDHYLIGVGPGMYPRFVGTYTTSFIVSLATKLGTLYKGKPNPHNFFLIMGAENGILGFVTAIFIFGVFFYLAYKCVKYYKDKNSEFYVLAITIFAVGLGVLINSFFEVTGVMSYGYITNDLPFWLVYVILIYLYRETKNIKKVNLKKL